MTYEEFLSLVENGSDIMFKVGERGFSIFTWMECGFYIKEWYTHDSSCYETASELIDSYMVDGVALKDLVEKIVMEDYS